MEILIDKQELMHELRNILDDYVDAFKTPSFVGWNNHKPIMGVRKGKPSFEDFCDWLNVSLEIPIKSTPSKEQPK